MGIYYSEQSRKGLKVKLEVRDKELEKYLESWDQCEDLLGFSFLKCYCTDNEYVIWCLKYDVENSHKIMRSYEKKNDESNLSCYRDDVLDTAYHSRIEGKLLRIDESLISEYDKDITRATFYPMILNDNVNPWNDINVIVESTQELCGREYQLEEVECYVEEIKNALVTKNFVYDIKETISIIEASFE